MITLHGYWRSTASWRVRIALGLKDLPYRQETHDLRTGAQRLGSFTALSPQGLVPAIEVDGTVLTQSLAIIEWLEEQWPEPRLLPPDPAGRAIVRSMAQIVACDIHPLNNLRVLTELRAQPSFGETKVKGWIARWTREGLAALEVLVARHGGRFAYGDEPGMADCCLIPQLFAARRFEVEVSDFPHLLRVAERAEKLDAFSRTAPAVQPDAD